MNMGGYCDTVFSSFSGYSESDSSTGTDSRVTRKVSFDGPCPGYVINQTQHDFRNEATKVNNHKQAEIGPCMQHA